MHSSEASGNGHSQQCRIRVSLGFLVEKFLGVSEDKLGLRHGCQCFSSGTKLLGWFVPGSSQAAALEAEVKDTCHLQWSMGSPAALQERSQADW